MLIEFFLLIVSKKEAFPRFSLMTLSRLILALRRAKEVSRLFESSEPFPNLIDALILIVKRKSIRKDKKIELMVNRNDNYWANYEEYSI